MSDKCDRCDQEAHCFSEWGRFCEEHDRQVEDERTRWAEVDQARAIARELLEVARSYRRLDVAMPGRLRRIIAAAEERMQDWEEAERVPDVQPPADPEDRAIFEREVRWLSSRGKSAAFLAKWSGLPRQEIRRILAAGKEEEPERVPYVQPAEEPE